MDTTVTFGPEVRRFLEGYPYRPIEEYEPITVPMFQELSPEQEQNFREWARDHLSEENPPSEVHHPIIHDEWSRMQRGEPMG